MQRTKRWLLWWLLLYLVSHNISLETKQEICQTPRSCCKDSPTTNDVEPCMTDLNNILNNGYSQNIKKAMEEVEDLIDKVVVTETMSISLSHLVFSLQKYKNFPRGITMYANNEEVSPHNNISKCRVSVQMPGELDTGSDFSIAFCLLTWPEKDWMTPGASDELYQNTMVGLKVSGKKISGLRERVNITMVLDININDTRVPSCVFYNFTNKDYSSVGCQTFWKRGEVQVTCSCDHLTYFGVLMVSAPLSAKHQKILTYISQISCGLSLIALFITVLIFITNRTIRADVSMKIHINLAVALILLNVHFINIDHVPQSSTGLCLYMALFVHYSLLATFSWMALEGFHIYLLLVKVFNIYIKKYLLKLALVGWGIPAIIVSLVVIIDRDAYGRVVLDSSNPNSTEICYIANNTVKMVTTVGVFCFVFIFNVTMFALTVRSVLSLRPREESNYNRAKKDICTLMGVTTLLGITWGLIFFSFGYLSTAGLYLFCILNSLQGVFILLWFVMSWRKNRNSASVSTTNTTSS
ncbi:adhesion G-protein coupled receptor G1-like isoform X2 [Paralichthys olivaceus]|uniref:adhesion G-protein coupled receptor G1-like isoform X2 n=1 Tax=Paralichthys olivaceus TaxID=8255 RepID=UPI003750F854